METIAILTAVRAVRQQFEDVRLDARVRAEAPAHRFLRTRDAVSRALIAAGRRIAANEPRATTAPAAGAC